MTRPDGAVSTWLHYRWNEGMLTFVLSRVSALLVAGYLVTHILVLRGLDRGAASFNQTLRFLSQPLFRFLEIGLIGVIIAHALLALRVVLMNLGMRSSGRRAVVVAVAAVGIVLFAAGAWLMLPRPPALP